MMTYSADSPLLLAGATKTLTMITAVGAGVAGGVFFAFSTFVMPALHRLPKPHGMAAMQSINRAAPNPLFMAVLLGTGVLAVVVAVCGLRGRGPATPWLVVGAACYLAQIVLTVAYHVPHNDALAALEPAAPGSAAAWQHYYTGWTLLNHVRTIMSIAASSCFVLALRAD
jgi:uncharacterized membrane protein